MLRVAALAPAKPGGCIAPAHRCSAGTSPAPALARRIVACSVRLRARLGRLTLWALATQHGNASRRRSRLRGGNAAAPRWSPPRAIAASRQATSRCRRLATRPRRRRPQCLRRTTALRRATFGRGSSSRRSAHSATWRCSSSPGWQVRAALRSGVQTQRALNRNAAAYLPCSSLAQLSRAAWRRPHTTTAPWASTSKPRAALTRLLRRRWPLLAQNPLPRSDDCGVCGQVVVTRVLMRGVNASARQAALSAAVPTGSSPFLLSSLTPPRSPAALSARLPPARSAAPSHTPPSAPPASCSP